MATTLTVGIEIDAPRATLWRILSDFSGYPRWNRFTPTVACSGMIGEPVTLQAQMREHAPPREVRLTLRRWEPGVRFCWGDDRWYLQVERCQSLYVLSPTRTRYENTERFAGALAPLVILTQRQRLIRGYRWVAEGLRSEAERLHRGELS